MTQGYAVLKSKLPRKSWTDDQDIIAPHLVEWRDRYQGQTPLLIFPASTAEVVQTVEICRAHDLKIVPQGGNTGLVGGQIPQGEILVSMKNMTRIRNINPITNSLIAEAGASLKSVQEAADQVDRKFPLSLASEGSCTIGGNLSTNAGGVHVLKYGTTKELAFGVEAVLPNGSIHRGLTNLRKDNTGYDLNRLFMGAEGTLGIITAASLKLFAKPGHVQRAFLSMDTPEQAMQMLDLCRVADHLAMFEVIPAIGLQAVIDNIPGHRNPFTENHPWYVLIDWETESEALSLELAEKCLGPALENGLIRDAVIAKSETQAAQLLSLRENMSAAQKFLGGSIKHDITIPIDKVPEFIRRADAAAKTLVADCRPVSFGHLGDGNIHYNIAQPVAADKAEFLDRWDEFANAVFDVVDALDGSISAEHGIGTLKKHELAKRADPVKLQLLQSIKTAIDPDNIMNPRSLLMSP